jgi:hypothetical protein
VGCATYNPAVRMAVLLFACVLLALLAAGCGGKDEPAAPPRSALAAHLARLCNNARADTEALGLPGDKGFVVMKPTALIGLDLAKRIKALRGTTPAQKKRIADLAEGFRFYYNELLAAVKFYEAGHPEVYGITLGRAKPSLESAEALATRMGAPECAVRPFPDR